MRQNLEIINRYGDTSSQTFEILSQTYEIASRYFETRHTFEIMSQNVSIMKLEF